MKKIVNFLFHRMFIVGLSLVLQVAIVLLVVTHFNDYYVVFNRFCFALSIVAVFWIVSRKSDPAYKIAWIIPILIFPIFGGLIYLMFGGNRLGRRTRRKMEGLEDKMTALLRPDMKAETLAPQGEDAVHQARYLEHIAHCPVYRNTETEYFSAGELCFPRLLGELKKAERYIFVEYFIIEHGKMWDAILAVLTEKAKAGLDVRLMYDDVGSMFTLPRKYASELEAATGIRCCVVNPFVPVLSLRLNNRDHRKICAIDGKVAFTGGINLADEYINEKLRFGYWKDSAILLRGEAAWSMAVFFLSLWDYVRGTEEDEYNDYRPAWPQGALPWRENSFVQPYIDTPLDDEPVGQTVYLNLINKARRYVYITTPYLVIDDTTNTALCNAAKSGVDVRIMTPHIPDKPMVFELTRAYYPTLLEAGVRIFEYTPGFVHGKNFAVDDKYATVGTINMDYRSLFLHFENGVWLCNDPTIIDIKADFLSTQQECEEVTLAKCRAQPLWRRAARAVLKVFAPLV